MIYKNYSKEIYSKNKILTSIEAYSEYADISLQEDSKDYICCFENCRYDEDLTVDEFSNYIIACMNVGNT